MVSILGPLSGPASKMRPLPLRRVLWGLVFCVSLTASLVCRAISIDNDGTQRMHHDIMSFANFLGRRSRSGTATNAMNGNSIATGIYRHNSSPIVTNGINRNGVENGLWLNNGSEILKGKLSTLPVTIQADNGKPSFSPSVVNRRKIVVTGLGVVSSVGLGVDEFWDNLISGFNPCKTLENLPKNFECRVGCPVDDSKFKPENWYKDRREARKTDRYAHFAMAASKMAVEDAKLNVTAVDPTKFGVLVSSGIGGIGWIQKELEKYMAKGTRAVSPYLIPAMISNVSPGSIAIEHNARGPNFSIVSACASGTHTIGEALRVLQRGEADVILAGGSEAAMTDFAITGFNRLTATARGWNNDPKRASRPFDKLRSGFVMGEGSGVLLLESEEHALKRGARIYAELAGYGSSCDAHHVTAPRPDSMGLIAAMVKSLDDAQIDKTKIGYINAHGTSTPLNDKAETTAFKQVFGEHARNILISSTKSQTGHCLGAAGGIEAVAAVKALETSIAPPTLNQEVSDPDCDLFYCPNKKVVKDGGFQAVMSTSLGFGGQNGVLVFKKYPTIVVP